MAKTNKSATPAPASATLPTMENKEVSNMEAVRQALAHDPSLAGQAGADWVNQKFGKEMTGQTFSTNKSQINAREGGSQPASKGSKAGDGPTLDKTIKAMGTLQKLIAELDNPAQMIDEVATLVEEMGGAANVKKLLDALVPKK
jgi:hypothetical protein